MNPTVLHKISYGLYLVTSLKGDKLNGQTANAVFQVTSDPPSIAIGINKQNLTHEFISSSNVFGVSILGQDAPLNLIGRFGFKSGRDVDKFDGLNYRKGATGVPVVLDNTLAYLEAKVINQLELMTHTLFVGEMVAAEVVKDGEPMTYAYYHQIKRGTTPKTAPTFIPEVKKAALLPKYHCNVCSYVYDPEKGEPDSGVEPGTAFEDLPDDWVCPICGADKEMFESS
ncbi:MAG: flavin reductase [Thermodesulfobacteriota bacterium]|nr:flavin reductase [Thermodesulfobacteriota bacterium]